MRTVIGLCLGMLLGVAKATACEPPMPNVVRLNPFVVQGAATLLARDRPLLPRNVDFSFAVLHVDRVDVASFRLRRDQAGKGEAEETLTAEARGTEVRVRVHANTALLPATGYSVYGGLAGKRQRVLQFQTTGDEDRIAPDAVKVLSAVSLGRFAPANGLCDDGHARVILSLAAAAERATSEDKGRYLIEGAGEPALLTAWCNKVEVALPAGAAVPSLRVSAVDLAGNRGPATSVAIPAATAGSWEALQAQRECAPTR